MSLSVSLPCDQLTILGRYDRRENALAFDWTNSGVYFRFCGKTVTFRFDAPALSQQLYVKVWLDGQSYRLCVKEGETDLEVNAATDGEHTVYCVRTNEILDAVPLVMREILIDGNAPALLAAPALPERRMLFIGDSITCGFGNLTKGVLPRFLTCEQDGSKTFAAMTAAHFQAQAHFVCISGRGIARNCDNCQAPLIPEFFNQTTISNPTSWDHTQYQPDLIVVNAGTNDTAGEESPVDPAVFKASLKAFATSLLETYPNAKLLWCYGMMATDMTDTIREVIESLDDSRAMFMPFRSAGEFENECGGCWHPNVRAHYRCAGVLIDTVSNWMNWDL